MPRPYGWRRMIGLSGFETRPYSGFARFGARAFSLPSGGGGGDGGVLEVGHYFGGE